MIEQLNRLQALTWGFPQTRVNELLKSNRPHVPLLDLRHLFVNNSELSRQLCCSLRFFSLWLHCFDTPRLLAAGKLIGENAKCPDFGSLGDFRLGAVQELGCRPLLTLGTIMIAISPGLALSGGNEQAHIHQLDLAIESEVHSLRCDVSMANIMVPVHAVHCRQHTV